MSDRPAGQPSVSRRAWAGLGPRWAAARRLALQLLQGRSLARQQQAPWSRQVWPAPRWAEPGARWARRARRPDHTRTGTARRQGTGGDAAWARAYQVRQASSVTRRG